VNEEVSISRALAALGDLGYREVAKRGDLVSLDVLGTGSGFPVILDTSMDTIPLDDLLHQLDEAGVDRAAFFAGLEQHV
jgi:hypothetical protein